MLYIIMSDIPEYDPTKPEDQGAAGGATGGGDENPQDYRFPDVPGDSDDPAAKQKRFWDQILAKRGAKPKDPYQKLPQDDKDIPMSKRPDEKNGLPDPKGGEDTEKTSFIEGMPSGRVKNMDSLKIALAH